jgi:hypothetical protein
MKIIQIGFMDNPDMPAPALLHRYEVRMARPRARSALVATAIIMTILSIAVFTAVTATGGPAIVGPIGPTGPFADLHHALTLSLTKNACWLAAASGGAAVLAGLAAVRRGWRPSPGLVLAACAVATVVFVFIPPAASIDVQNYAEYGRMVVLGHNPWEITPQRLYEWNDPVGLLRPLEWRNQPTVYGPAATAVEATAAWLGGTSMAWIVFWIKIANGMSYIAVAVVLDRLAGPDPARRARVAVLWTVNPLMLFWLVAGAHTDLLALLPLVLALWALRALWAVPGGRAAPVAGIAGALAGISIAVKVTFAAPVAGLAVGLWRVATGPRRGTSLASMIAGGALALAAGYAFAGPAALQSLSQRLSSAGDSFLPLPGFIYDHVALYAAVSVAAVGIVGGILAWRMPPGHADLPWTRPMAICAIAMVLGGIVQYPWYDAMFFPLLALLPASGLDGWLVGRAVLISGVVLPGIGIKDDQYRAARVLVPTFLVIFLVALALGRLRGGDYGQNPQPTQRSGELALPERSLVRAGQGGPAPVEHRFAGARPGREAPTGRRPTSRKWR